MNWNSKQTNLFWFLRFDFVGEWEMLLVNLDLSIRLKCHSSTLQLCITNMTEIKIDENCKGEMIRRNEEQEKEHRDQFDRLAFSNVSRVACFDSCFDWLEAVAPRKSIRRKRSHSRQRLDINNMNENKHPTNRRSHSKSFSSRRRRNRWFQSRIYLIATAQCVESVS